MHTVAKDLPAPTRCAPTGPTTELALRDPDGPFAHADARAAASLLDEYAATRQRITTLAQAVADARGAESYSLSAAQVREHGWPVLNTAGLFAADGAYRALDAAKLLRPGSRLVAVLPAPMIGKTMPPSYAHSYSEAIANAFAGASVAVTVLTLVPDTPNAQ